MTTNGENIVRSMSQLSALFREIALLLKTADECMKEAGWSLRTNQCVSLSSVPDGASYWFPHEVFRFYKKDNAYRLLPFVSVVMFVEDLAFKIDEPLLSGGWHDYGEKVTTWPDFKMDYAGWHPYMPNRRDDGQFISVDPRKTWPSESGQVIRTTTMAVPLIGVTTADDLEKRVIRPLVSALSSVMS